MADAARPRRRHLAVPASRFLGRERELAAIAELFRRGERLVTVWGPAGMGKTRLALELASRWDEARPAEAVWLCELTACRDLRAVCGAVARAIGAQVAAGRREATLVERIGRALATAGPALFVLDNLEHVLEQAAPALDAWVRAAPEVRFLATSRERTRLPGEIGCELGPLELPAEGSAERSAAVALFLDRAAAHRGGAPAGDERLADVAALVRRLEGIPLAIELAAAREGVLGVRGLLARLGSRLDLLAGAARGREARQATMRSAIEWSWDLLDDRERRALACCSVFRGPFTLAAAAAVLAEPDAAAIDRIEALRDKSLLRAAPPGSDGATRFALYEGVRELAAEKLAERGEREAAAERHAAFYLAAGEAAAADFERRGALDALNRIAGDLEELLAVAEGALAAAATPRAGSSAAAEGAVAAAPRAAAEGAVAAAPRAAAEGAVAAAPRAAAEGAVAAAPRAAAERALRALSAIEPVLSTRGPFGAQLELLDRALAAAEALAADPRVVARALAARGRARRLRGQAEAALEDLERARAQAAALDEAALLSGILADLGVLHHGRRDMERARDHYEQALALHRALGDRRAEGRALGNLGALHHDERREAEAAAYYERAIAIAAEIGDGRQEGIFSTNAGLLEQERGAPTLARRRYERAAAILGEVGDLRLLAITLGNLGALHHEEGRLADARACHGRAVALLREVGDRRSEAIALCRLGAALASVGEVDEARRALDPAERLLAQLGDEPDVELARVASGFVDLALAQAARRAGQGDEAAARAGAARRRIARAREGSPSSASRSDDVRLLLRILERSLAALGDLTEARAGAERELLLTEGARFVRPPGSGWHDLRERHAARRLLLALAEQQRCAPGRGLSLAALKEAGWPGERILPEAAANRIYVAMNQLRKLGMKPWLRRDAEGYSLDPALPVHYVAVEPGARGGGDSRGETGGGGGGGKRR
ncbi:ATP-binding protein [Sorangium sp. So ce341]|uniref:ATP-binding protein n=1 Tax=Sorangium sp. So ce341 TaxID=3133302 RepID=UPI003F6071AF